MPRFRPSWTDAALVTAAVVVGIAAEAHLYAWSDPGGWLPDLLTGWALVAFGLAAGGRPGLLLAAGGLAWFAGNFSSTALLLHRAPVAQLVLTFPLGRTDRRIQRGCVALAYVVCIVGALWAGDLSAFALAAVLLLGAGHSYLTSVGMRRRQRAYALRAAALFAGVLAVGGGANIVWDTAAERSAVVHVYEAGLVAIGAFLLYGLRRQPWQQTGIVDLVVDLGESRTGDVRDALASALGDATLDVAYRVDGGYVDAAGRPVGVPRTGPGRHGTRVERDGVEVAVIVHDAALLDDPALLEAVGAATRLAATNARLQAEVREQVVELDASRRRLVAAGDDERRRLEERLRAGALERLTRLDARLTTARAAALPTTAGRVAAAQEQLARTSSDLRELAAGLHPRVLVERGLAPALAALTERSPIPVELQTPADRLPGEVELTLFFVCSEALANAWKHANASRVAISIERDADLARVKISDDGVGGAEPRSLADRVEAIGGTLEVDSPRGGGTRIVAEVPIPYA